MQAVFGTFRTWVTSVFLFHSSIGSFYEVPVVHNYKNDIGEFCILHLQLYLDFEY